MSLPTRQLGRNGPKVPALGFGAMGLSAFYGKIKPDEERYAVLDRCLELGETFWDSADIYADSEDLIGRWFKRTGKRDEIFLATKFAFTPEGPRGDPPYIRQSIEKSLRRLGTDYVDLYYVHRIDPKTPIEVTIGAMAELVKEGKVKYLGLSECSADTLRRACKVHHIAAVQVEYSPFFIDIENKNIGLLDACRELGVAIVAYSPLGRGMISGTQRSYDDLDEDDRRRTFPRYSKENFHKNLELVDKISEIAKKKGCTPGQLTLAWVLAQGEDFFPIPGTTKIPNLEENLNSLKITIAKDEEKEIRAAVMEAEVAGSRYRKGFVPDLLMETPKP